ncbi:MAG TPA: GH25 family lysozyme [Streptosporangiaceae bacterium]|jgi:lysozyme|nr:GH25 family lysozyme [Streptosporangiaceae bacterium]
MRGATVANAPGIDVSSYQGAFNWQAQQGKISFAFIKATEGITITDPEFGRNWRQAKSIGIVRGAYHFGHPADGAASDARAFLSVVRANGLDAGDLLALDLETADGLPPARVAEYARNWCSDVEQATGRKPVVYTFLSFAQAGNCAGLGGYPLWIAEPSYPAGHPVVPRPWTQWAFHQYNTAPLDRDVFNGDDAALKRFAKLPVPAPQEAEVQSGTLVNGARAVTAISIPEGSAKTIGLSCDNALQGLTPASLRVAIWDGTWTVHGSVTVESATGQTVIKFATPDKTSAISIQRLDAGEVSVGYQVS